MFKVTEKVLYLFIYFGFLGPHPHYMEVPRPGGQIKATAANSHSNTGSEPHLQPTPQLMAMLDP